MVKIVYFTWLLFLLIGFPIALYNGSENIVLTSIGGLLYGVFVAMVIEEWKDDE